MANEKFRVHLEKEQLVFSAAHFITFGDNVCERLHGHNYRVKCEVAGALEQNGYVVDFIALRDTLMKIVESLDHRVLLPTQHPTISVTQEGEEIVARFEKRRWVFPVEDCVLLPIANTTAELLARHIGQTLIEKFKSPDDSLANGGIEKVVTQVDENHGQWGVCELTVG